MDLYKVPPQLRNLYDSKADLDVLRTPSPLSMGIYQAFWFCVFSPLPWIEFSKWAGIPLGGQQARPDASADGRELNYDVVCQEITHIQDAIAMKKRDRK